MRPTLTKSPAPSRSLTRMPRTVSDSAYGFTRIESIVTRRESASDALRSAMRLASGGKTRKKNTLNRMNRTSRTL